MFFGFRHSFSDVENEFCILPTLTFFCRFGIGGGEENRKLFWFYWTWDLGPGTVLNHSKLLNYSDFDNVLGGELGPDCGI